MSGCSFGKPFGTAPYPLPAGRKGHRYSMQASHMFHDLGTYLRNEEILQAFWRHTRQILDQYIRLVSDLLLLAVDPRIRLQGDSR